MNGLLGTLRYGRRILLVDFCGTREPVERHEWLWLFIQGRFGSLGAVPDNNQARV